MRHNSLFYMNVSSNWPYFHCCVIYMKILPSSHWNIQKYEYFYRETFRRHIQRTQLCIFCCAKPLSRPSTTQRGRNSQSSMVCRSKKQATTSTTIEKYEKQPTIAQEKGYRGVGVNAPNPPVMIASIDMEQRSYYKHSRQISQK